MGQFRFNTIRTWNVAHHHGHSALRLLRIAKDIENDFIASNEKLQTVPHGQIEYLRILGWREHLTTDMFRISSASVMMFQAMMEAIINDSLETEAQLSNINKNDSFRDKWTKSLTAVQRDTSSFVQYFQDIYTLFRNPLVHPKKIGVSSFDSISFGVLLSGYEAGWRAYAALYDGLGHGHDKDSWATMCGAHEIQAACGWAG